MRGFTILRAAAYTAAGGGSNYARNCTITYIGAGIYDYTLSHALPHDEMMADFVLGTTDCTGFLVSSSDTVKRFTTREADPTAAAAAKDCAHYISFWRTAWGLT